eukprot:TRINITY_DN6828_c0_g1_i1.p1 TRINITY_DN6828_c0_g1~~TRINITY_DN6828_c0_g1_i1.p1  ORF type:complete len:191 (-),score=11.57 TRINITY_DN6828_c0_g1_i1:9-581(-)
MHTTYELDVKVNGTHYHEKDSYWIRWSEMPGDRLKTTYLASVCLTIGGALMSVLFGAAVLLGLVIRPTGVRLHRFTHGFFKWYVWPIGLVAFLSSILGWAVFVSLPQVFEDEPKFFCPERNEYWCSTFTGSESDAELLILTATSVIPVTADLMWGPSAGWILAVVASAPLTLSLILTLLSHPSFVDYKTI